jgi:eukaryotic-like serine/threonine-protein kinase
MLIYAGNEPQFAKFCYNIPRVIETQYSSYEVVDTRLCFGGNASVYPCLDQVTGTEYAVKFQLNLSRNRVKRFKQESKILESLSHEQIVTFIDQGNISGTQRKRPNNIEIPFLIMSKADNTLDKYKKIKETIPYEEYIAQFRGLCDALSLLHKNAIHRDIKPENILIQGDTWLLSDLGLCDFLDDAESLDITREDEPVGPRYWMSPESINKVLGNGDNISKESDVFQLCSVFWYVVTGRNPYGIVNRANWTGSDNLFELIASGLSHSPLGRPKDGQDLLERLNAAVI